MRILFWNTNRNSNINQYIASLVVDYKIDIFVAAEYSADKVEFHKVLSQYDQNLMYCNTLGCNRINVWSNYINVKSGVQDEYYSIQIINDEFILCCVHLFSDLHGDQSEERLTVIQKIIQDINSIEDEIGSKKTIIIGDMNEMPYDRGCLNANGFHGLPSLDLNDKPTRIVKAVEYRKFYNPMWNLMGDFSYPPGTYYLNQSVLRSPMWYMLDQVILSKDILPLFDKDSLKIITSCSYGDLMDRNQHPDCKISDHFPIMCEIRDRLI